MLLSFLLLSACHVDPQKQDSTTVPVEVPQTTATETEPQTEDTPVEDSGITETTWDQEDQAPACDPPLSILPEEPVVPPLGGILLQAQGGSGAYRYQLAESEDAEINPQTGFFQTKSQSETTHLVTLQDALCRGEASAEIRVTTGMSVVPSAASLLPETTVTLQVSGHSGAYTCEFVENASGASLDNDCNYTAGPTEGIDTLLVTDSHTAEWQQLTFTVDAEASLKLWGTQLVLPLGAQYEIQTGGGSGFLETTLSETGIINITDQLITTQSAGALTISVSDRYVDLSQELIVQVATPLQTATLRMGSNVSASTPPRAVIRVTDIQGDGIPDAIIGMPELGYNTGESGLVSIHLGTATGIEAVPTQVLGGYTADSQFGSALAIDDFNDDGMVDLAIGAYYDNVVKTANGAVYLYYGTGDPTNPFELVPTLTFSGSQNHTKLGQAIDSCDVDGDGWIDLVVGSIGDRDPTANSYTKTGSLNVYLGTANGFSSNPTITRYGAGGFENWDQADMAGLGETLVTGDFNGDTYCDIAVVGKNTSGGANYFSGMANILIFTGGPTGLSSVPEMLIQSTNTTIANLMLSSDLDGDGTDTLLVGNSKDLNQEGSIIAYDLDFNQYTSIDASHASFQVHGDIPAHYRGYVGRSFALGDHTADGIPDLIIGLDSYVDGAVIIIDGIDLLSADPSIPIMADGSADNVALYQENNVVDSSFFGNAVQFFDGLGYMILVGKDQTYGLDLETIWFYPTNGTEYSFEPPGGPMDKQGAAVAWIDANGDGLKDAIVGGPQGGSETLGVQAGHVISYAGTTDAIDPQGEILDFTFFTATNGIQFATQLNTESDFDGDGWKDLVVMAHRGQLTTSSTYPETCASYSSPGQTGFISIFRGSSSGFSLSPSWVFYPQHEVVMHALRLKDIRGGLDINGDGKEDLIVGSSNGWGDYGGVLPLLGREAPVLEPTAYCQETPILSQSPSSESTGHAITPLGDIDNDGCDEFAVSAFGTYSTGPEHQGTVKVIWGWGGANCPAEAQITNLITEAPYHGVTIDEKLASDITGGLDIDGDAIPDLLSSAVGFQSSNNRMGVVWMTSGAYLLDLPRQALDNGHMPPEADSIYSYLVPSSGPLPLFGFEDVDDFGKKLRLVPSEDGTEAIWLAVQAPGRNAGGGVLSGAVELYAFDRSAQEWDLTPRVVISGDLSDAAANIGQSIDFTWRDDNIWVLAGMPDSSSLFIDHGGAIAAPLVPDCKMWYVDADGDGYGDSNDVGYPCEPNNSTDVDNDWDCDDSDASIYPHAAEIESDGIDQDCDGSDALPNNSSDIDDDGDGVTENQGDCDDSDSSIAPTLYDIPDDTIDQNCDGIDGTPPSFNGEVLDFVAQYNCASCHSDWATDYTENLARIDINDPENSLLYLKIDTDSNNQSGDPMPKNSSSSATVDLADTQMLLYWISIGAPEN